jgi:hypothetical protein
LLIAKQLEILNLIRPPLNIPICSIVKKDLGYHLLIVQLHAISILDNYQKEKQVSAMEKKVISHVLQLSVLLQIFIKLKPYFQNKKIEENHLVLVDKYKFT